MSMPTEKKQLSVSPEAMRLFEFLRTARAFRHLTAVSESAIREWTGIDSSRLAALHVELVNVGVFVVPVVASADVNRPFELYIDGSTTRKMSAVRRRLGLAVHDLAMEMEENGGEKPRVENGSPDLAADESKAVEAATAA